MTIESRLKQEDTITPRLQLVAWELTRSCNLFCAHCRGSAGQGKYDDELSTEECFHLIDQILEVGKPIIILTGGEPLVRQDVLPIAKYAVTRGLRVVMGSNGTLITQEMATKLKKVPISRIGISLDFPTAELQDDFRGKAGAFEAALAGIINTRQAGIEVQINSTITKLNVNYLNELLSLALKVGAVAFHPFMLVPTGRGKGLESVELPPEQYEQTLNWIYDKQLELGDKMFFKPTDVPHYLRVVKQRQKQSRRIKGVGLTNGRDSVNFISRGCLAGTGFCFISHRGKVKGCGYLDVEAGDIRKESFSQIWSDSPLFCSLRDLSNLKGKCGVCEYKRICGGCRARAYEATGDYLEAEPYCIYEPAAQPKESRCLT
ncbi:MAG: radical SAM protein [Dehalococcoidales bacterium]